MMHIFMHEDGRAFDYIKEVKDTGNLVIMRFRGEVDAATIPIIRKNLKKRAPEFIKKNVLIDLKDVTHIDTATLATFVDMLKKRKEQHTAVALVNVPPFIHRYLEIEKLESFARIYDTEEAALAELS